MVQHSIASPWRARVTIPFFAIVLVAFVPVRAQVLLYASGTLGQTGQTGGNVFGQIQYLGVRFSVSNATTITAIGGHIGGSLNGSVFGAIIRLTDFNDFPDSMTLSTPDVLAVTSFTPTHPSAELVIPIGPAPVTPGVYAVMFGSGLFGASGSGFFPTNSSNIGSPSWVWKDSVGNWRSGGLQPQRMTVYTPEPSIGAVVCASALSFNPIARGRSMRGSSLNRTRRQP